MFTQISKCVVVVQHVLIPLAGTCLLTLWREHLHPTGHDLNNGSRDTILPNVLPLLEASLDKDFVALAQVGIASFCKLTPSDNSKPLGLLLLFAG